MDMRKMIKTFLVQQDSNTAELSRRLGYSRSNLYDKYRRNTFSVDDLERIAEAYGHKLKIEFIPKD
jgi:DNA-binding NtrC family response regulator